MSQSIIQLADNLPSENITVSALKALDFVVPGEWQNTVGFANIVREITGKKDPDKIQKISERALWIYNDQSLGYQKAIWLYQIVDNADSAMGMAAMANKVSQSISFLGFLNKLTPKADTIQSVDLCIKLVAELIAFCILNRIPIYSIPDFVKALPNYHNEAVMRMAALVCFDGLIPLGPDFLQVAGKTINGLNPAMLEQNPVFQKVSGLIPGNNAQNKLGFISQTFNSAQGWMGNLVSSRGLKPNTILGKLQGFVDVADDKLDYVAAFLDMTTNYYEHTGIQTVSRYVIKEAAQQVKK
ncbi:MAG TPA: hypothetical protein V6D13_11195 [Halomicronema sp.]